MIEPRVDSRILELVEQAFDYRGFVTLAKRDGSTLVGFVYDRTSEELQMFDEKARDRITVPLAEIADVQFTGEDTAAKAQAIWERRKGSLESPETSPYGDWEKEPPALILVALEQELKSVAKILKAPVNREGKVSRGWIGEGACVALSVGMGGGASQAVLAEKPRLVLSVGFSGALDASLQAGDLVLASSVTDENGEAIPADAALLGMAREALQGLRFFEGGIVCATRVAATADEKRALAGANKLAVDLESWPAAKAAQKAGIPWLGLRAVLDPLESELPPFTRTAHDSYVLPALRYALGGPRCAIDLTKLALKARAAQGALEQAMARMGPVLGAVTKLAQTAQEVAQARA